jgi:hypothetical protein
MKKLLILSVLFSSIAHSQWVTKTVDTGLIAPYRICHSKEVDGAFLKLEKVHGSIVFYIQGDYIFESDVNVELAFLVNEEYKKYSFPASTSKTHDCVFFTWNLMNSLADEDFQKCSSLTVNIYDLTCNPCSYTFNMEGSVKALEYIKEKE